MHKLAQDLTGPEQPPAFSGACSLIVRSEGQKRSFRIEAAPPEGSSYARDIAEKYGVTYAQLIRPQPGGESPENAGNPAGHGERNMV